MKKDLNNTNSRAEHSKGAVAWGRAASPLRPGIFVHQYFKKHREACCADVYRALSEELEHLNQERAEIGEKSFHRPNYSSFSRYFHWFLILGLIVRSSRREPAAYDFLQQKVFYKLTERGKSEMKAWADPIMATHPEFRRKT